MNLSRSNCAGGLVMMIAASLSLPGTVTAHAAAASRDHVGPPLPVFSLVEGAKKSPYPYSPNKLVIPAGKKVVLKITDHLGGCALVTVFPKLGPNGGAVRARVPVGQTRKIVVRATSPGHYPYHCADDMYYGEIIAR